MAYAFPSVEWTQAYKDAINASAGYKKAGKTWTHGTVAMVILADPSVGIKDDVGMLLDVHEGSCRSCKLIGGAEAESANFVIKASYAQWKKVLKKEVDPTKALMQGQLKLTKGHMPTMVKYVGASKELVEATSVVATAFPDEQPGAAKPAVAPAPAAAVAAAVAAPKAEAPAAAKPAAEAPKAEAPKAEAPKAEAPKAAAPKATEVFESGPTATQVAFDAPSPRRGSTEETARDAISYALRKAADAGEWVLVRDLAQQAEAMASAPPWALTALARLPWVGPFASRFLVK